MDNDAILEAHIKLLNECLQGVDYWSAGIRSGSDLYFAYLEEADAIEPEAEIVDVNQRLVAKAPRSTGLRLLRFSAVPSVHFMRASDGVTPLPAGERSAEERNQRTIELLIALRGMDMPVLEVLLAPHHAASRFLDAPVVPWWFMVFRATGSEAHSGTYPQAYRYGDGAEQPVIIGELPLLAPVPEPWNARLIDIFSLAHVPDADFGSRGNENEPSPLEPAPVPSPPADAPAEEDDLEGAVDLSRELPDFQSGGSAAG